MADHTEDKYCYKNYVTRDLSEEENKKLEELEKLNAWKKFSKYDFGFIGLLKPNTKRFVVLPIFGITGRLATDDRPEMYAKIPDVLEFFKDDGIADRLLKEDIQRRDILALFNINFDNKPEAVDGVLSNNRNYFPQQHLTAQDYRDFLGAQLFVHNNSPASQLQITVNERLSESYDKFQKKLKEYQNESIDSESETPQPETEEQTKCMCCQNDFSSFSVNCCDLNQPICFTCVAEKVDQIYRDSLFIASLIPCRRGCSTGIRYPIQEQQLIRKCQYSKALKTYQICTECKRACNEAENPHQCMPADTSIKRRAEHPEKRILHIPHKLDVIWYTNLNINTSYLTPSPPAPAPVRIASGNNTQMEVENGINHRSENQNYDSDDDDDNVPVQASEMVSKIMATNAHSEEVVSAQQSINEPVMPFDKMTRIELKKLAKEAGGICSNLFRDIEDKKKVIEQNEEQFKDNIQRIKQLKKDLKGIQNQRKTQYNATTQKKLSAEEKEAKKQRFKEFSDWFQEQQTKEMETKSFNHLWPDKEVPTNRVMTGDEEI